MKESHFSEKRGEVKVAMEDTKVKVKDENQNETKADEMVPDWLWGGCNHKYDHAGTLCFYTPIIMTVRSCTEDYALPGSNLVLKKNEMLTFNADHYHKDPKHWSHPDVFYPDHWTSEEKSNR